jgi:hypothetical protein
MASLDLRRFAAVLLVLFTVACSGDPANPAGGPTGTGSDPQITINTDDFHYQLSGASGFSTGGGYAWRNTGTVAKVTISNSISSGNGTVAVLDTTGRTVWSGNLTNNGTFNSVAGPTGEWRVEVLPSGVSGSMNIRIQKD